MRVSKRDTQNLHKGESNTHMSERWVEFQGRPNAADRGRPRVTLSNRNVLLLNRSAFEALGSPAAVKLKYEEDRRVIGVMPGDPRHSNAFPVRQKDRWYNRVVNMQPFCRHYGIDIRRTVLFNEIDIDGDGMMRLELNHTITIGRAERNVSVART